MGKLRGIAVPGDKQNFQIGALVPEFRCERRTVHTGHYDVADQKIDVLRMVVENVHSLCSAIGGKYIEPVCLQDGRDKGANERFIINCEDRHFCLYGVAKERGELSVSCEPPMRSVDAFSDTTTQKFVSKQLGPRAPTVESGVTQKDHRITGSACRGGRPGCTR